MSEGTSIRERMGRIDDLMTLYADCDSLSCLPRFLDMYLVMDPRVIDREWMGDWELNRVMYAVIPDNRLSLGAVVLKEEGFHLVEGEGLGDGVLPHLLAAEGGEEGSAAEG